MVFRDFSFSLIAFSLMFSAWTGYSQVSIKEFQNNKVLYDFNETTAFKSVIKNESSRELELTVNLIIKKGVDEQINIPGKKLTIPANSDKKLEFEWNTQKSEYGHAAFLRVLDKDGKLLDEKGPLIFEVCHDWRKIMRSGSIPVYRGVFDPNSHSSSGKYMETIISFLRDWGYNRMHFFGSWQPEIDNLTPVENEWHYWRYKEPEARAGWENVFISKDKIKEWISSLHENGIKATMYIHTPTYKLHDEGWIVYSRKNGKRIQFSGDSRKRQEWLEKNDLGVPECLKFCDEFGRKVADAVKEYGWDGCYLDDYGSLAKYTSTGCDKNGKALTEMSMGELHAEGLKRLVGNVVKAKDNFVFIPNGLHKTMYGIEQFPARDMFGKNGEDFPLIKSASVSNFAYGGEWRAITKQANSPWQLGRSMRAVREATGAPLDIVWTIACPPAWASQDAAFHGADAGYTYSLETILPFTAVILSNGIGYLDYYSSMPQGFYTDIQKNEIAMERAKYLKFAARYGQYIYDLDIHWTPKNGVNVLAPGHVYWKGNTFERRFSNGKREVYVHLINFDKMYLAAKLWDRTRTVPEQVKGIAIQVKLENGEKLAGAFAASPDTGAEPLPVPYEVKDAYAEISSPLLKYWNMIVLKIEK